MSQVNWYGEDVTLKIAGATQEMLDQLALEGEGLAKINIRENDQIDTGFMMNSVAAITSKGIGELPLSGEYEDRAGKMVHRESVPLPEAEAGSAGIGCAAEYAIYQEMKQSFLYRALEKLSERLDAVIERVAREKVQ